MTLPSPSASGPPPLGEILKGEGDGAMLRISVEGGGLLRLPVQIRRRTCSGRGRPRDLGREGAVVLVDPASVPFLAGSELDFVDDLIGASFRVVNPNAYRILRLRHQFCDLTQLTAIREHTFALPCAIAPRFWAAV